MARSRAPHPAAKPGNRAGLAKAQFLHRDGLGSVRAITNSAGARIESSTYKPFGEQIETVVATQTAPETKGWIGERYDADAGLQYLNARYYDRELGMFIQPDWWEVTWVGVGTNRFAYSFGDPVNKMDPGGNDTLDSLQRQHDELSGLIDSAFEAKANGSDIDVADIGDWISERDSIQSQIDQFTVNETLSVIEQVNEGMKDFVSRKAAIGKKIADSLTSGPRGIRQNQIEGARRHAEEVSKQKGLHPTASVQSEQYLRDSNGKILKDDNGKGRRLDIVVIDGGKIVGNPIEVTSMNASKAQQLDREATIHANNSVFVRDRTSGSLVEITGLISRVERRP